MGVRCAGRRPSSPAQVRKSVSVHAHHLSVSLPAKPLRGMEVLQQLFAVAEARGVHTQVPTSPSSTLCSSVLFAAQDRVQNAFLASVRADGARATNTQLSAGTLRNRRSGDPGCFLADAARRDSFPRSLAVPLVLSKAVSGILRSFPARRRTAVRRPGEPSGSELSLDLKGTPRFRGELPNTPLAGDARRTHQRTRYRCPDSFRPVSLFFCTSALAYYSLARAREGATQSSGLRSGARCASAVATDGCKFGFETLVWEWRQYNEVKPPQCAFNLSMHLIILRFTCRHAASCGLHRPTSRAIHR